MLMVVDIDHDRVLTLIDTDCLVGGGEVCELGFRHIEYEFKEGDTVVAARMKKYAARRARGVARGAERARPDPGLNKQGRLMGGVGATESSGEPPVVRVALLSDGGHGVQRDAVPLAVASGTAKIFVSRCTSL